MNEEDLQAVKDRLEALEERYVELRAAILSVMNLAIEANLMLATDDSSKKKVLSSGIKDRILEVAKLLYPNDGGNDG